MDCKMSPYYDMRSYVKVYAVKGSYRKASTKHENRWLLKSIKASDSTKVSTVKEPSLLKPKHSSFSQQY